MRRSYALPSTGTEALDWQEVWCFTCRHDHEMSHPGAPETNGCEIFLRALTDQETPEIVGAGYTIEYLDEHGDTHTHEIPPVCNSLPAAAFCTSWEPCEQQCRRHINGAVIVDIRRGESWGES